MIKNKQTKIKKNRFTAKYTALRTANRIKILIL